MLEPATTITDFLLALECVAFAVALSARRPPGFRRTGFQLLFVSVAVAALAGGAVHGYFPDETAAVPRGLWLTTLLALGVTAALMAALAARMASPGTAAVNIVVPLGVALGAYAGAVILLTREFVVAIVAYLPAALFLVAVLWRDRRHAGAVAGLLGVALVLVGAAGQQAGIGLHPVHFDHNALYHVVQMVALYLLYRCARDC